MMGLYIHIPFCIQKCNYCDFYSVGGRLELLDNYVDAVLCEAMSYHGTTINTIYIGGGTPSLLGAKNLRKLLNGVHETFNLSELKEATVEINPDSASVEFLTTAHDYDINRVSIGIQSLNDYELQRAGRIHNAEQAAKAVKLAKGYGFENLSADVIIGLPGQTWHSLFNTLKTLIGLGISHLSVYCLSIEEGTPFAIDMPPDLPSDDYQVYLYEKVRIFLAKCGFNHYEISNFALAGRECLHNLNYWREGGYIGLGAAASSHIDSKRFKNAADLERYIKNPKGMAVDHELLGPSLKVCEETMLRLRLIQEGVDTEYLRCKYGNMEVASLIERLNMLVTEKLLVATGAVYRLQPDKIMISNRVFTEVLV